MRQILFRGKRIDNDEWAEGYLFKIWNRTFLLWGMTNDVPNMIEVKPETVGQYTGLTDKNGNRIFEGDIVRYETITRNGYEGIYKVVFENRNGCGYFGIVHSDIETYVFCYSTPASQMEIIGDIYDNKELL